MKRNLMLPVVLGLLSTILTALVPIDRKVAVCFDFCCCRKNGSDTKGCGDREVSCSAFGPTSPYAGPCQCWDYIQADGTPHYVPCGGCDN